MANQPKQQPRQPAAQSSDPPPKSYEKTIALWTIVLGASTVVLSIATIISAIFLFHTDQTIKRQVEIASAQSRAAVGFEGGTQVRVPEDKPSVYVIVGIYKNYGATRTAKFNSWASLQYFEAGVPNNLDWGKPYNPVQLHNSIIGPNASSLPTAVSVKAEDVEKLFGGKGALLWWGRAEYSDIFEPEKMRPVNFCILLVPVRGAGESQRVMTPIPYKPECNTGS